jgi:pimeloyl-ACP methyl ester carboxylesterase
MPNLLLLHGLGHTPQDWNEVMSCLDSFHVRCPDLLSDLERPDYFCLLEKAEDLIVCQTPLCLMGHSLGAILALDLALRHPDKVQALILISPQYKVPRLLIDVQNLAFSFLPEHAFSDIGLSKTDMIALCKSMRTLDFSSRLQDISCPVVLICGEKDFSNKGAAKQMAKRMPQTQLCILPHTGHEPNKTHPSALAAMLADKLCSLSYCPRAAEFGKL